MSTRNAYSVVAVQSRSNVRHPARDHVYQSLVMASIVFFVSFGIAAHVHAAKVDCKPDFEITNGKAKAVKVLSLVYTDSGGNDFTGARRDKKLSAGEKDTWKSVKLQHVYENNLVKSIRVEYRNDTSGEKKPSDPWGPAVKTISLPKAITARIAESTITIP